MPPTGTKLKATQPGRLSHAAAASAGLSAPVRFLKHRGSETVRSNALTPCKEQVTEGFLPPLGDWGPARRSTVGVKYLLEGTKEFRFYFSLSLAQKENVGVKLASSPERIFPALHDSLNVHDGSL